MPPLRFTVIAAPIDDDPPVVEPHTAPRQLVDDDPPLVEPQAAPRPGPAPPPLPSLDSLQASFSQFVASLDSISPQAGVAVRAGLEAFVGAAEEIARAVGGTSSRRG